MTTAAQTPFAQWRQSLTGGFAAAAAAVSAVAIASKLSLEMKIAEKLKACLL